MERRRWRYSLVHTMRTGSTVKGVFPCRPTFVPNCRREGARVVYVYPSPRGGALEACDRAFMQRMADSLEQFDMFSDEEDDLASIIVSEARRVSIDGEGRIVLPPELIGFAEIDERVTFVGRGARFSWDPTTFAEKAAEARERAKGRTMRLLPPEGRE